MQCPKCGEENKKGAAFCAGCGAELEVKEKRPKKPIIIAAVLVLCGMILGVVIGVVAEKNVLLKPKIIGSWHSVQVIPGELEEYRIDFTNDNQYYIQCEELDFYQHGTYEFVYSHTGDEGMSLNLTADDGTQYWFCCHIAKRSGGASLVLHVHSVSPEIFQFNVFYLSSTEVDTDDWNLRTNSENTVAPDNSEPTTGGTNNNKVPEQLTPSKTDKDLLVGEWELVSGDDEASGSGYHHRVTYLELFSDGAGQFGRKKADSRGTSGTWTLIDGKLRITLKTNSYYENLSGKYEINGNTLTVDIGKDVPVVYKKVSNLN